MTAKEMFKAIGFVPFFETKDLIIYENFPDNKKERIDVIFYLKNKKIRAYYVEPQFRSDILESLNKQLEELDSCKSNSYVVLQKNTINQFKNLIKSLPDGYPIPVERRNGR